MSESEVDGSNGLVCRDFLRNVCRRGSRCKFVHKTQETSDKTSSTRPQYNFCHDFQNSQCMRNSCRFVHGSQVDEEYYKNTGELPPYLLDGTAKDEIPDVDRSQGQSQRQHAEVPDCKDYLKGECRRGANCRFRHVSVREYEPPFESSFRQAPLPNSLPDTRRRRFDFPEERYANNTYNSDYDRSNFGLPEAKRRYVDAPSAPVCFREISMTNHCYQPPPPPQQPQQHHQQPAPIAHIETRSMMFYDENSLLRKRIDELKKQVSDLTATNEFLLDQNAHLRMSGKRPGITMPMPSVTITNAGTSTMQVQPMIQSSSIPTSAQHLVSAAMAGTLRTVTASVATVPVSIATVAGAPVSIATVSMAPMPQPPIVTMAQTITVDGSHGSQLNGGTASLLSYPIMTHDLRPVLQTSMTH